MNTRLLFILSAITRCQSLDSTFVNSSVYEGHDIPVM